MDGTAKHPAYIRLSALYRRLADATDAKTAEVVLLDALAGGTLQCIFAAQGPQERTWQMSKSDWIEIWHEDHLEGPQMNGERNAGLFASVRDNSALYVEVWTDVDTGEQYHELKVGEIWVDTSEAEQQIASLKPSGRSIESPRVKQRHHTKQPQLWAQRWLEDAYSENSVWPDTKESAYAAAKADYEQQHPDQRFTRKRFDAAWENVAPDAAKKRGRRPRKT